MEQLCPLPYKNSSTWNKLPCSVEIKKTLKKGIAVHYQQGPELKKRYGNSISSKMSSLSQADELFMMLSSICSHTLID